MKVKDVVIVGLMSAALTAGKLALSFMPNVEIVTLFLMLFAVTLGLKRALLASIVFVTTEILLYGFSTWVLVYYALWPCLVVVTTLLSRMIKSEFGYAALAGIFGFSFGFFSAVFESFFYGPAYGIAYWLRGITFDVVHGASNFIIVLMLFSPLHNMLKAQAARFILN
ncbi:MAG TPA: hypothetical protein PK830_09110 [Candidatus Atribacteria bacterium]|nr:hypothetical protein [Candidatus Atribacteria bacterium]HPT79244.1 hypothetical protein [Candidatus Atribacteria bacterium]